MRNVFFWSLVAAIAGLLFGFDTVLFQGQIKNFKVYGIPPMLSMGVLLWQWLYGEQL